MDFIGRTYNSGKRNKIDPWLLFSRDYRLFLFLENHPELDKDKINLITAMAKKLVISRRDNRLWKVKISSKGQSAAISPIEPMQSKENGSETKEVSA